MQRKNVEDKNGGEACQGSGEDWKGENGRGMESVCRRMPLYERRNWSKTHPTRNGVCACLNLIFIGTKRFLDLHKDFFTLPLGLDWLGTRSCTLLMRNMNIKESRVPPAVCVAGGGGQGPAASLHPEHACFNQNNASWWLLSNATTIILITICQK